MLACLADSHQENNRMSMRIDKVTPRNLLQFSKSESQLEIKTAMRVNVPSSIEIGCMLLDGNSVWIAGSGLFLFDAQVFSFILFYSLSFFFFLLFLPLSL